MIEQVSKSLRFGVKRGKEQPILIESDSSWVFASAHRPSGISEADRQCASDSQRRDPGSA